MIEFMTQYGLVAMFLFIILEYACLPLPSEVILPLSGAMVLTSGDSIMLAILISIMAGLIGSMICYSIGYTGGNAVIDRMMKKYPSTRKGIESTRQFYAKYATCSVGLGRVIPLFRTYISFIAGITKQRVSTFLLASTLGIAVWNTLLMGLGYWLADEWKNVMGYYDSGKWILLLLGCAVIGLLILKKSRQKEA
ncbi:DedA family protein [Turicibacter sanguinis]|uniref:DedA family protein n=1 Tax=Turicibacter sanguinis TaxID=154288 RepID=UPI0021D4ADA0|nr:DedA family protein [Turicibacter sanguinis]MCU7195597.1 DedA family protein [Turicibacter sanguinis]